jgi:hypothetical protein
MKPHLLPGLLTAGSGSQGPLCVEDDIRGISRLNIAVIFIAADDHRSHCAGTDAVYDFYRKETIGGSFTLPDFQRSFDFLKNIDAATDMAARPIAYLDDAFAFFLQTKRLVKSSDGKISETGPRNRLRLP